MSVTLRNNTVRWTAPFLARRAEQGAKELPNGIVVGYPEGIDPGELMVAAEGNRLDAPSMTRPVAPLLVHSAVLNGKPLIEQRLPLATEVSAPQVGRK